jgi:hypothetical protein
MRYVADLGNAGLDRGQGGKYLLLPPGYEGDVPEGYFVFRSSTYRNWVMVRRPAVAIIERPSGCRRARGAMLGFQPRREASQG